MIATTMCTRRGCRQSIIWAESKNGKRMPINAKPDPAGNLAVWKDPSRDVLVAYVFNPKKRVDGDVKPGDVVYMPHAATCAALKSATPPRTAQQQGLMRALGEQPLPSNVLPFRPRQG